MRVLAALMVFGLTACDEPPASATLSEVPAPFTGKWAVSDGDCRDGGGAQLVRVSSNEIVFSDSVLTVKAAAPDGDTAVRADGHFKTADAEWDGSVRLELSEAGAVLNIVNGSTVVPRVKCR